MPEGDKLVEAREALSTQEPHPLEGVVVRSTGSWYSVATPEGDYACRLRGRIRLKGVRTTNPVAVGDHVTLSHALDGQRWIESIAPRRNYMIRRATNLSRESQVIAANLDLALVIVTLAEPPTPLEFIDRFLATATAYSIPAAILLAKQDLRSERAASLITNLETIYPKAGYPIHRISAYYGTGIGALRDLLTDKVSLLCGHSGVGKSSLINALEPSLELRTAPLSVAHQRGQHTTTHSQMYHLEGNIRIIDTPGIKGFGLVEFAPEEVSHYFPDLFALSTECRFPGCLHLREPGCAVRKAVREGQIAPSRYQSYTSIIKDPDQKYR